jgi:Flp pilus assembly protein TadG
MTMQSHLSVVNNDSGSAAAEMALVTPLLLVLMFGAFELGTYFWVEHVAIKSVRDGARFAGRQSFTKYTCGTIDSATATQIKNLTRTGVLSGGKAKIAGWEDAGVTVTVTCPTTPLTTGIYAGQVNAPQVTVAADFDYSSLFQSIGFTTTGIKVRASAQSAVMGI